MYILIAFCKARKMHYNPTDKDSFNLGKTICLPYNPGLQQLANSIRKQKLKYNISFRYNNTLRGKLVKNNSRNKEKSVGVYAIPCNDCNKCYIGESGRFIDKRKKEHITACKFGNSYNAVAKHTWENDHKIDFKNTKLIYKCQNRSARRVVEGALISLNDTFENNKGLTKDDVYINENICKTAKNDNYKNISAKISSAASLSFPAQIHDGHQHVEDLQIGQRRPNEQSPEGHRYIPPNEQLDDQRNLPPRRSLRLLQMNHP